MKKLLRTFILATIMSLSFSITALAATAGNGTNGDYVSSTGMWEDGVSWGKSGFLIYVVTGTNENDIEMIRKPVVVWVGEAPSTGIQTMRQINARLAPAYSIHPEYTGGAPWGMPPFNDSGSGNGAAIKDWLCSQQGAASGAYTVIQKYWGEAAANDFVESGADLSKDTQYLCVETVTYHGLYSDKTYLGCTIAATAPRMVYFLHSHGFVREDQEVGQGYPFKKYDFQNVPLSLVFQYNWLGVPPASNLSGRQPWNRIVNEGYGIIAVRPTDIGQGNSTHTWDSKTYPKGSSYKIEKAPKEVNSEKVTIVKTYREKIEEPAEDEDDDPETVIHYLGTFYRDETLKSIRIEDEDGYKVIEWQTSTETKPTKTLGGSATWEEVTEFSTKTHTGSKSGYTTLGSTEYVLYVLLEKSDELVGGHLTVVEPEADSNFDYVEEWEIDWVNPSLGTRKADGSAA